VITPCLVYQRQQHRGRHRAHLEQTLVRQALDRRLDVELYRRNLKLKTKFESESPYFSIMACTDQLST